MSFWQRRTSDVPLVVGHRGGRGPDFPVENTLDAFERARAGGARAMELDVQASGDGEAVVVHDTDLARITGGADPRPVAALEWAELRAVALPGGARIPRLSDVLDWAEAYGIALNVEVKRDGANKAALVRRVARLVRHAKIDVLLSSFDPALLALVGALAPGVPRAWLTDPEESPPFAIFRATAYRPLIQAIHPRWDQLTESNVRAFHARGLAVGCFTVNEPEKAARVAALGVDWIITDRARELSLQFSQSAGTRSVPAG